VERVTWWRLGGPGGGVGGPVAFVECERTVRGRRTGRYRGRAAEDHPGYAGSEVTAVAFEWDGLEMIG
jgi:hypothetical protein